MYVLYVGRIDESKGCSALFEQFLKYKLDHPSKLKLVLLGKPAVKLPDSRDIIWVKLGWKPTITLDEGSQRAIGVWRERGLAISN